MVIEQGLVLEFERLQIGETGLLQVAGELVVLRFERGQGASVLRLELRQLGGLLVLELL